MAAMATCEVCGVSDRVVTVASSVVGAVSVRYCPDCLRSQREPYGLLVAVCYGIGSYDELSEQYKSIVDETLEFFGKTRDEFFADVAIFGREYEAACLHV